MQIYVKKAVSVATLAFVQFQVKLLSDSPQLGLKQSLPLCNERKVKLDHGLGCCELEKVRSSCNFDDEKCVWSSGSHQGCQVRLQVWVAILMIGRPPLWRGKLDVNSTFSFQCIKRLSYCMFPLRLIVSAGATITAEVCVVAELRIATLDRTINILKLMLAGSHEAKSFVHQMLI